MPAVIFDLDGVLVSTDRLHADSLAQAIHCVTATDVSGMNIMSAKSMMSTREKLRAVQSCYLFTDTVYDQILALKDSIFFGNMGNISVERSVLDTLEYVKHMQIKTAIASNSRHINISKILAATGLRCYFDVVASAEDVPNRKPAPDILFYVYQQLGLCKEEFADTLFIEDSDEGAAAGHSSPSTVIRINNPSELTVELLEPYIQCIQRKI